MKFKYRQRKSRHLKQSKSNDSLLTQNNTDSVQQPKSQMKTEVEKKNIWCNICFEDICIDLMHQFSTCKHVFCFDCVNIYITTSVIDGRLIIMCPHHGCNITISDNDILTLTDATTFDKLIQNRSGSELNIYALFSIFIPYETCFPTNNSILFLQKPQFSQFSILVFLFLESQTLSYNSLMSTEPSLAQENSVCVPTATTTSRRMAAATI